MTTSDHRSPAPLPRRFAGRVLLLVDDASMMRAQLEGQDVPWTPDVSLRHDISTDEITPAYICYHYDETLGDFPYLGLRAGSEFPVTRGAVRGGGFAVSVSGRRRGKGSSREQAPFAEFAAGVRLIVAESFEGIYRENCRHLGVLTSTDFGLLRRIARGEAIPLEEFTRGQGEIARGIIERGGLFPYNLDRLAGRVSVPPVTIGPRPMTLGEKILARHWVASGGSTGVPAVAPGDEGFVRTDIRFSHEYVTPMAAAMWRRHLGDRARVADPDSVFLFRDHLTFLDLAMTDQRKADGLLELALELKRRQEEFADQQGIRLYGELPAPRHGIPAGAEAICHARILERHALPGQVIVGSDSHTPHAGALGCIAFGIGTTAVANAWLTKDVRVTVPPSIRVQVAGRLRAGITAKDVMLQLLRQPMVREGGAIGRILEYAGPAVAAMSIDERATLTNMAAEMGAFTALVAPDEIVADFLERERGMAPADIEQLLDGARADAGARYERVIELNAAALRPMVALPGDPGNGICLDELGERVPVDIAYAGSCTGGKKDDMDMYARVLGEAAIAGRRVPAGVRFYIQFGSQEVRRYAERMGYVELFRSVGAEVLDPSCGACINAGPGVSYDRETITVSAINRNFPGRSGPGKVYLASPYTTAASALAGYLTGWRA